MGCDEYDEAPGLQFPDLLCKRQPIDPGLQINVKKEYAHIAGSLHPFQDLIRIRGGQHDLHI